MARLAALQPRHREAVLTEWAASTSRAVGDLRQRINPVDDHYDDETFRAWIAYYQRVLLEQVARAGARGVDLVLLPEGTLPTGAFCRAGMEDRLREVCRWSVAAYLPAVAALAKEHHMVIASCLNYADGDRLVNAGILTDERGEIAGIYHKSHLPGYEDEPVDDQEGPR
ncbi:MAG: nitrilase-related carbon-nitrogen hydrolase [Anaerolineae bacterium]